MSITEKTVLDGAMTVINPQHPIMKAWLAYKQTEGYRNTFKWAAIEEHRDGSLWSVFLEGYQSAVEQPTCKTDEEIRARIARQEKKQQKERDPGMRVLRALLIEELRWVLGE